MTVNEIDQTGEYANYSSRWGSRVRLFVLHTQEGPGTAQSLANYFRSAEVSYHYVADNSTCIDVIDTDYASWSVLDANPYCINLCFAGSRASQSRDVWLRQFGDAIDYAAFLFVQDARKYNLEARVIGWDEIGRGKSGGTDHQGITEGLGIGTHTDCGPNFPWDVFAAAVLKHAHGQAVVQPAPPAPNLIDAEAVRAGAWLGARVTAGEQPLPGDTGRIATFEHGSVYWKQNAQRAIAVPSALMDAYSQYGWETGALGFPIGDHTVLVDSSGAPWGDVQGFEGGALYRRYGQPGFAVWGAIRERWNRSGFENGTFGWPTGVEVTNSDGSKQQQFERGLIVWSPDGTTALKPVDGPDTIVPDIH
ncbi:hypothetical protein ROP_40530 [Rhodococcus opacus B4]|uniref:N-acetylmuramoyl-L-alanine amidase domain-containing protein n=1 Tax=Rhodococcus opacus (strain B4) TaxID=632772 RepID=C1B9E7_RHOOB|nr:N-acetylmuramoyl-L-alanine amidase [Rhodococcus opacus]BAH52300.1 hypothetical protein ROP_40530 [Rhodococcus opacus B4]